VYVFEQGLAVLQQGPWAVAPEDLAPEGREPLTALGNGCAYLDRCSAALRLRVNSVHTDSLPDARDIVPLARQLITQGTTQAPADVNPAYVRNEINWKKIPEQGRPK